MTDRLLDPSRADIRRRGQRLMLVGWTVGLAAALAVLLQLGRDRPGTPPLTRPADWGRWFTAREPLDAAAAVCRLVAIVLIGYLLALTVVQVLLAFRPSRRRRDLVDRAGPRFLAVLTATLAASTGSAMAGESGLADPATPTIRPGLGATMELVEPAPPPDVAGVETFLPWAPQDPHSGPAPGSGSGSVDRASDPSAGAPVAEPTGEWVVRPGDHLWSIAAEVVERATGARPDDRQVRDYWVRLIDANRDRLVDPENPDLILAGQRLRLP